MNLEYRKVSLFEYIYGKKINFSLIFKFFEMHLYIETCHYIVRTIVQKKKTYILKKTQQSCINSSCQCNEKVKKILS